jgi:hypothetical protein
LPFPGMINDFNFLAPILARMHPSNSFMDGSAIGRLLPVLKIPITALRAVSQRGQLQPFVPVVPEECTSPVRTLLLACVLLQISSARFLFGPAPLLLVLLLLIALLFQLALPLIEEDTRGHPGFVSG